MLCWVGRARNEDEQRPKLDVRHLTRSSWRNALSRDRMPLEGSETSELRYIYLPKSSSVHSRLSDELQPTIYGISAIFSCFFISQL